MELTRRNMIAGALAGAAVLASAPHANAIQGGGGSCPDGQIKVAGICMVDPLVDLSALAYFELRTWMGADPVDVSPEALKASGEFLSAAIIALAPFSRMVNSN